MKLMTASLLFLSSVVFGAETAPWPQWRGPDRDCRIPETAWPSRLVSGNVKRVARVALGESYSGPIVSTDRVFVTEAVGAKEVVRALSRSTGDELWRNEWAGSMTVPFFAASNGSWIRSTPALAKGRLFVASMEDVLFGLDASDGRELWRKDFRQEFGTENQSFGFVCSPIVDGDFIYVQTAGGLVKLSCDSGDIVWRGLPDDGGMMGGAFSSPVIAILAGERQLVVQTRQDLTGVSLEDGTKLWAVKVPSFRGMNILTPTVIGDRIYTSSYGGGSLMFQVSLSDGSFQVSELWKAKPEAYMSSPVVVDGKIYVHLRNQRFACLDSDSGKVLWTSSPFGKYWSMAVNGTKALVLDERGDLLLLDLNASEFVLLDKLKVTDESAWAHLAVAGNEIFVRDLKGLTVYHWMDVAKVTSKP